MAMTLITTNTSSNASSSAFTSSIDSTYKLYIFKFININPATDGYQFAFNVSIDGGSNYNVAKTTTAFQAHQAEDGDPAEMGYDASADLAQGTGYQRLSIYGLSNAADASSSGELYLFNPSSTTYAKHFYSTMNSMQENDYTVQGFAAGYANTTSAVNAVDFKMLSGNFDGTIKMYGVG